MDSGVLIGRGSAVVGGGEAGAGGGSDENFATLAQHTPIRARSAAHAVAKLVLKKQGDLGGGGGTGGALGGAEMVGGLLEELTQENAKMVGKCGVWPLRLVSAYTLLGHCHRCYGDVGCSFHRGICSSRRHVQFWSWVGGCKIRHVRHHS